jgi:hypothetical protein
MKPPKQTQMPEPQPHIEELDASPGATAVSEVAMGGSPKNIQQDKAEAKEEQAEFRAGESDLCTPVNIQYIQGAFDAIFASMEDLKEKLAKQ